MSYVSDFIPDSETEVVHHLLHQKRSKDQATSDSRNDEPHKSTKYIALPASDTYIAVLKYRASTHQDFCLSPPARLIGAAEVAQNATVRVSLLLNGNARVNCAFF